MAQTSSADFPASVRGRAGVSEPFGATELVAVMRKRAALVRNVALGVIGLTLFVLLVLPSTYTGSAVVMLDPRKNNVAGLSSVLSELPTDPASVQNQIQILMSRDLAGEVIQRLDLESDPEFNPALSPWPLGILHSDSDASPESQYTAIIDAFLKHLSVDGIGLSTAISVKFSSTDPTKAARIANAIADAYIESQIAVNAEAGHRTTVWLAQRIRELARQVGVAEANVQRYKAENAINDTGTATGSVVEQQLAAINTQLVQARADLAAKQANYDRIAAMLKSGNAADVSQVVSSPLIVQLRTQQSESIRDEAELASRYGPKHPKRIAVESQLRDLQGKIDQEVNRIAGSVASDLAVARAQVKSLEQSLSQAVSEDNDQNLARVQLKALESDAASTRTMYEAFVTRLRETQGQDAVQVSDARVISHASVPIAPSSPRRLMIFAASVPAGVLLGLLWALLLERAAPGGLRKEVPAPGGFRVPVIAEMPRAALAQTADLVCEMPQSPAARAISLMTDRMAAGPRIIAVTSLDPRDANSSIGLGLARSLARRRQRVILIEANPAVTGPATDGARADLANVIEGTATLGRAVMKDSRSDALLLGSASARAWQSPRMGALLTHLLGHADVIIVDAPTLGAAEMRPILAAVQGFLVVARKDDPGLPQLGRSLPDSVQVGFVLTY